MRKRGSENKREEQQGKKRMSEEMKGGRGQGERLYLAN